MGERFRQVTALAVLEAVEVGRARGARHVLAAMPTNAPVKFGIPGAVASSDRMLASKCSGIQRPLRAADP